MKKKPFKNLKKQPSKSPSEYFRGLLSRLFRIKEKSVFVKSKKEKTYEVQMFLSDLFKSTHLNQLRKWCKKNRLKLDKFSLVSNGKSNKLLSRIEFEIKQLNTYKRVKSVKKHAIQSSNEEPEMTNTAILAQSLNRGLLLHAASEELNNMVLADAGQGLRVLRHGEGARLANQIFQEYVSDRDYTNFLGFLQWLDDGLYKFRGNQALNLEDLMNDDDDDDQPRRGKGKKGKKSFAVKNTRQIEKSGNPDSDNNEETPSDNSVVISQDTFDETTVKNFIRERARKKAMAYCGK